MWVFFGGGSVYVNDSCYPCNNEVISCSPGNPKSHLMSSTAVQCVCVFVKLVDRLLFALLRVWNKYGLNSSFNSLATQLHDDKNLLFSVQDLYKVLKFEGHSNPKHVENFLQILIMTLLNSWLCEKLSLPVNRIKRWCAEHNKEEKVTYFFFFYFISLQSDIKCVHPILFLACQMLATHSVLWRLSSCSEWDSKTKSFYYKRASVCLREQRDNNL